MPIQFSGINGMVNNQDMIKIQQICSQHKGCIDCPVLKDDGLHSDNCVTICEKLAEKFYRNINHGNGQM